MQTVQTPNPARGTAQLCSFLVKLPFCYRLQTFVAKERNKAATRKMCSAMNIEVLRYAGGKGSGVRLAAKSCPIPPPQDYPHSVAAYSAALC